MCGRFQLSLTPKDIKGFYRLIEEVSRRYEENRSIYEETNTFYPGSLAPVLTKAGNQQVLWGVPLDNQLVFNGRAESIEEKPMFRDAIIHQRCIVPATRFFEWNNKRKFDISLPDAPYFFMAGLTKTIVKEDGRPEDRLVIITTVADKDMAAIHSRMPVILPPEALSDYLDPKSPPGTWRQLLKPWHKGLAIRLSDQEQLSFFDQ